MATMKKEFYILIIFFVFVFVSLVRVSNSLEITDFSFEKIDYDYFGNSYGAAVSTVLFNEDVYLVDSLVCPYDTDRYAFLRAAEESDACPPCNYADKSCCGCSPRKGCECDQDEVELYCKDHIKDVDEWILQNEIKVETSANSPELDPDDWAELNIGVTLVNQTTAAGTSLYYRYHHKSFTTGFQVNVLQDYGSTTLMVSRTAPFPSRFEYDVINPSPNGPNNQLICPVFAAFYPGTWYIAVQATVDTTFTISIAIEKSPATNVTEVVCPGPEIEGSRCIVDGETVYNTEAMLKYVFYATECKPVTFSLVNNNGADFDLYLSFTSLAPTDGDNDYVSYLFGDDKITASFCPENPTGRKMDKVIPIYAAVYRYVGGGFWLTVTSDENAITYTKVEDIPRTDFINRMVNVVNVTCGYNFYTPCQDPYFTCTLFWPVFPSITPVPFFPVPPIVKLDRNFQLIRYYNPIEELINQTSNSRMFRGISLLSKNQNELIPAATFEQCVYTFLGRLVDKDGIPANSKLNTTSNNARDSVCEPSLFLASNERVVELVSNLRTAENTIAVNEINFEIESYLTTPIFSACQKEYYSLYSVNHTQERIETIACTKPSQDAENDPCCNPIGAGWNEVCYPSYQEVDFEVLRIISSEVSHKCGIPECSSIVLENDLLIKEQIDAQNSACGVEKSLQEQVISDFFRIQIAHIYINCKDAALGTSSGFDCPLTGETPSCFGYEHPTSGISCNTDSDCVGLKYYDTDAECDLAKHVCKFKREVQEEALVTCLLQEMPTSVRSILADRYQVNKQSSDDVLKKAFIKEWSSKDCVEEYGFALLRRQTWYYSTIGADYYTRFPALCATAVRLDPIAEVTGDTCRDSNDYSYFYSQTSAPSLCTKDSYYCNWDLCDGLSEDECKSKCKEEEDNDYFCALCENEMNCTEIQDYSSKSDCEKATVCILPDGTVRPDLSESECEAVGQCTQPCGYRGEVCETKEECEGTGGYCDGWYYLINRLIPEADGNCYTTYQEYDFAAVPFIDYSSFGDTIYSHCSLTILFSYYTPSGCVTFNATSKEDCDTLHEQNQNLGADGDYYNYFILQGDNHYIWVDIPKTKAECLEVKQCKEARYSYRNFLQTRYNGKTKKDCEFAGGEYGSVYSWTEGRWLKGTMKPLKWVKRKFDYQYKWDITLNFTRIAADITAAVDYIITSQTTTDAICKYSQTPQLQNTVFCDCIADSGEPVCDKSDYKYSNSHSKYESVPQIVVYTCAGKNDTIQQLSFNIQVQDSTIDPDTGCQIIYVYFVPIYQFQNIPDLRVSSSIVPMPDYGEFDVVQNKHGYIVGQLLGDGIRLEDDSVVLRDLTICFNILESKSDSQYTVIDIGILKSNRYFSPMGLTGRRVKDQACVDIPKLENCYNSEKNPCTLFPILRQRDYNSTDNYYSTTEQGFLYTLSALYFIALLVTIIEVCYLLFPKVKFLLQNVVQCAFLLALVMRGLYFVLVGTTHLYQKHDIADFIFIIFPTLIQLTLLALNVLIWAINSLKLKIKFYIPFIIVNIIIYGLFILCIILFSVLPTSESNGCGGRENVTKDQTGKEVVKAFFFCSLMTLAIALLLGMLIFGSRIFRALKRSGTRSAIIYRVFVLAVVLSASVIMVSIYLLIITFVDIASVYLTFGLFLGFEVLPILMLLYVLNPWQHNKNRSRSRSRTPKTPTTRQTVSSDSAA